MGKFVNDSYSNDGIECPYCGYTEHDDLPYGDGDTIENHQCGMCDKHFNVSVSCMWSWEGEPVDEADEEDKI